MADDDDKPKNPDRVPSIPLDDIVKHRAEQERKEREAQRRQDEQRRKDRKPTD